jgi:hypothetical protein
MNNEFITRYYSGTGAVLIPSHGIFQIYEDKDGQIFTYQDLVKEALAWYDGLEVKPPAQTNNDVVTLFKNERLGEDLVTRDKIQPGDSYVTYETVIVKDTLTDSITQQPVEIEEEHDIPTIHTLDTIEKYLAFKEEGNPTDSIIKSYGTVRDLKPSEVTFDVSVNIPTENGESIPSFVSKNIFDTESVIMRYKYSLLAKGKLDETDKWYQALVSFSRKFGIKLTDSATMTKYLNAWTQRNTQLLDDGLIMESIFDEGYSIDGMIDFNIYFGDDTLINDIYKDVKDHYFNSNSEYVYNYKFKPAELVLPDIYQSTFTRSAHESLYEIKKQGAVYFENKIKEDYNLSGEETKEDIKLIVEGMESPVYIRYVSDLAGQKTVYPIKPGYTDNIVNK